MAAPTWYDVLGVERTASTDEVRAAWRSATDRAEPGTAQFRAYNEALDTLVDPERRAAYDATLPPVTERTAPTPSDAEVPAPVVLAKDGDDTEDAAGGAGTSSTRTDDEADDATGHDTGPRREPGRLVRRVGGLPLAVPVLLLVLVLALAGVGAWLATGLRDQAREADAREQAPVAAEQAAEAMLSYDYRELPADRDRAEGYLAGTFKAEFTKNAELLETQADGSPGPAVQTKAVVTAQAAGSGVVDVSADGREARVLVFVNQTSEKEGADPQIFQNRVAMDMVERDGRWLVTGLNSY